jgi:glyoxylase-like metal-dependent hydrolase (beta-lactamase superfamily II)
MHPPGCGTMVCHVLLVETDNGLVLIDTGFGSKDCGDPARRLGPSRRLIRPVLNRAEAAVNQVEQLGFRRDDMRQIVVTHFDPDHIGGISDFPEAQIHVAAAEELGAMRAPSRGERFRFRPALWAHGPKIIDHTPDGEKWRGFAAAKELGEVSTGIALISLPGHTRGHACVAVDAGHRWVLHCGDRLSPRHARRNRTYATCARRIRVGGRIRSEDGAAEPRSARRAVSTRRA